MNWIETTIDLGIIRQNTTIEFKFISTRPLDIVKVKPSCGSCTYPGLYRNNELPVKYKSSSIPKHLKGTLKEKYKSTRKYLTVTYRDGSTEVIGFKANIIV